MSPSPASTGPDGAAPGLGSSRDLLSAPVAAALATVPGDATAEGGPDHATLAHGGCFARQLPLDLTCASMARRFFREAVAVLGLPADLIHDGVTMASELAANTAYAQHNVEFSSPGDRPVNGCPEVWVYAREHGNGYELVCKVFDSMPSWASGSLPDVNARTADAVRGRGLQVVDGLSAGQWGAHLTRGRLGYWKVPGKVVWFALRIPPGSNMAVLHRPPVTPRQAADNLEEMLSDRGFGGRLVRADAPGGRMSVLSVSRELTVWCHTGKISWQRPDGGYERLPITDLVEAAEQIVCAHEDRRTAVT
jgi:anti-sigma regulatory factor (Ser/Thr protein kinase)